MLDKYKNTNASIGIYIDKELKRKFKILCALEEESISSMVVKMITEYVQDHQQTLDTLAK